MEANQAMGLFTRVLNAYRAAPKEVLWRGYWETPRRITNIWPFAIYVVPILLTIFGTQNFLRLIAHVPALEDAVVEVGVAQIFRHPSRPLAALALKKDDGQVVAIYCRYGALLETYCYGDLYKNRDRYQGKRAQVWIMGNAVALQVQIEDKIVHAYGEELRLIGLGGLLGSRSSVVICFAVIVGYWLWVIFGFPYLNYKTWKREQ